MTHRRRPAAMALALGTALSLCAVAARAQTARPTSAGGASGLRVRRVARKPRPAPPLSYLRYNSYSVEEVIQQIEGDRTLLMRYANHFHIKPEQVVPYFRENLVESYVEETRRYPVWMKRPDGSSYSAYQTFRAGTRVLALRNGDPVLKWACGNPLSTTLPPVKKRVASRKSKVLPKVQQRSRFVEVETPYETPTELVASAPPYEAPPSGLSRVVNRTVIPVTRRRFPWGALVPLALVSGGGGGGSDTPPPPPPPPPPAIPEPSTLALALSGLAGAGVFMRKRRT